MEPVEPVEPVELVERVINCELGACQLRIVFVCYNIVVVESKTGCSAAW